MYLNIKVCLLQLRIRQNQLAQAVQVDETMLSKIINGFREPTASQRQRIAEFLQRDEDWLFARSPDPKPNRWMGNRWERESV